MKNFHTTKLKHDNVNRLYSSYSHPMKDFLNKYKNVVKTISWRQNSMNFILEDFTCYTDDKKTVKKYFDLSDKKGFLNICDYYNNPDLCSDFKKLKKLTVELNTGIAFSLIFGSSDMTVYVDLNEFETMTFKKKEQNNG